MKKYLLISALSFCTSAWSMNQTNNNKGISTQKKMPSLASTPFNLNIMLNQAGYRSTKELPQNSNVCKAITESLIASFNSKKSSPHLPPHSSNLFVIRKAKL